MKIAWMFTAILLAGCGGGGGTTFTCEGGCPETNGPQPGTPENITVQADGTTITLDWDHAENAETYNVYYSSEAYPDIDNYAAYEHGTWVQGVMPPTEITVPAGVPYFYFQITAVTSVGRESFPGRARAVTRFVVTDSGTVIDLARDVEWKRCREGQSWSGSECTGEPTLLTGDDAMAQYAYPPHSGWRIPTGGEFAQMSTCESEWCGALWPELGDGEFLIFHGSRTYPCATSANDFSPTCYVNGINDPTLSILLVRDIY